MSLVAGVLLSLLASVFKSGKNITTKLSVNQTDEYAVVWAFRAITVVLFALLLGVTQGFYLPTTPTFWTALLVYSVAFTATSLLIAKAYKVSDVSLISPLLAFTPLAVIIPAWILLQQTPTLVAGFGILLVTAGAYTLQLHAQNTGLLAPLYSLSHDQGARYIALALCIQSLTPSIDKIGLTASTPLLWVFSTHLGLTLLLTPIILQRNTPDTDTSLSQAWVAVLALGLCNAGIWLAQIHAYTFLDVAYVQAIKRVSILLSIGAGAVIFNEDHIRQRLLGGGIILVGVVLIILGG